MGCGAFMKAFKEKFLTIPLLLIAIALTWFLFFKPNPEIVLENSPDSQFEERLTKEDLIHIYDEVLSSAKENDLVLVEMSLSLIRNYYVDAKEFEFGKLILTTLENMKNDGDLNYKIQGGKIEIFDEVSKREIQRVWENDELGRVATIFTIAKFLYETRKFHEQEEAVFQTLSAVVSSLDPYSRLLSEDDYKELKEGTEGEFGGLGIMVGLRKNLLTVIKLIPHSPAARAGIRANDQIISVNGQSTFGASLEDLLKIMRGVPGTSAKLTFLREGAKFPFELSINRELVHIDPVSIKHIKTPKNNNVLMVKLDTFSLKSYDRMRHEIEHDLLSKSDHSDDGIILDLRSNPGGLLDQAVKISKLLLKEGSIVTVKGRETETEYANHENLKINHPIVVLIDEDSASASEILAGALKDQDRALIIGQPSYGKGTVQTIFELPNSKALKLTIARYLTPSGTSIQGVGVLPDIWLHPIFKRGLNYNLLGHYRYRLDEPFIGFNPPKASIHGNSKLLTGYYLKETESHAENKEREIELALHIFDDYKNAQGKERDQFRSSSLIAKLRSEIESKIGNWDVEASEYLKAKRVNWMGKKQTLPSALTLRNLEVDLPKKTFPGSKVSIRVQIQNGGNKQVPRSSLFIRAPHREMDTTEKLVGLIPENYSIEDGIEFIIPSSWLAGKVQFQIGLAVDGVELGNSIQEFTVNLLRRTEPILNVKTHFPAVLQAGKTENLEISVENDSDFDVHIDKIRVTNLSGEQLEVKEKEKLIGTNIVAHGEAKMNVQIAATKNIFSNQLALGLSVESLELKKTLNKIIYIDAKATVTGEPLSLGR